MTTYIFFLMGVHLNSLFVREIKVYHVRQVLEQGIYIKMMCPNYILEFRNANSYLLASRS